MAVTQTRGGISPALYAIIPTQTTGRLSGVYNKAVLSNTFKSLHAFGWGGRD